MCSSEIPTTQRGEVVVFETMPIMHLKHEVKMIQHGCKSYRCNVSLTILNKLTKCLYDNFLFASSKYHECK